MKFTEDDAKFVFV